MTKRGSAKKPAADPSSAELRSKVAITKLQSAIDQLEQALRTPPAPEVESPAVPPPAERKLPTPALSVRHEPPPAPPEDGWLHAIQPALATCVFLVIVGVLVFGYSVGYTIGSGTVTDPVITVASAADKPIPVAVEEQQGSSPIAATPAVQEELAPVVRQASARPAPSVPASVTSGRLHLQVSALKSAKAAKTLGRKLESEGFPVQVREPGADGLVRVLVGPVDDREQLAVMADRLREEGLKPFPKRL